MLSGLEALKGVQRAAPRLVFRTDASGYKGRGEVVDLIAFDPARDITVRPWLARHLDRPLRKGDVIIGGRREEAMGWELLIFGWPLTVYGKLGQTAVGTRERGLFITFPTLADMRATMRQISAARRHSNPIEFPGCCLSLRPERRRNKCAFPFWPISPASKSCRANRCSRPSQGLTALAGVLGLMAIMFVSTGLMVSVLFSAIITERRRELGLLRAIGAPASKSWACC